MNQKDPESSPEAFLTQFGRSVFDIGFCMSVTMDSPEPWEPKACGVPGPPFLPYAPILVEPQPWKWPGQLQGRLRSWASGFDHFRSLAIGGDMAIQELLADLDPGPWHGIGMLLWQHQLGPSLLLFRTKQATGAHHDPGH